MPNRCEVAGSNSSAVIFQELSSLAKLERCMRGATFPDMRGSVLVELCTGCEWAGRCLRAGSAMVFSCKLVVGLLFESIRPARACRCGAA